MGINTRHLQIEEWLDSSPRSTRIKPQIRLKGNWLAELGFKPNSRVEVQCDNGRLILMPVQPPAPFQAI